MTASKQQPEPIAVKIVEERHAPAEIIGVATTYNPSANGVQSILPHSRRRIRAVISVTGNGTVVFSPNAGDLSSAPANSIGSGFQVVAPELFELQSSNAWSVGNVTGTALVSVIAETEKDN